MTTDEAATPHTVAAFPAPGERPADLPDLVARLVRRDPDVTAVLDAAPDGPVHPVSRGELWRRVRALAEELREHGVGAGDAVAVWMPNWSDALVWQCAVAARGAHVVGVNTRYGVEEVAHVLARARPRLVALAHGFHGLDLLTRLHEAVAQSGVVPEVAVVTGPGGPAADPAGSDVGAGAWTPQREDGPEPARSDPGALAVAFTTSGSTGLPKLAAHTAAAVLTHAVADAAVLGLREGDVVLGALPLSGVFGYNAVMAGLAAGAAALLEPTFDADRVLDHVATHRVTHLASGDDLVLRLHEAWSARPRDLGSWRWWGVADFQGRSSELAAWLCEESGTRVAGVYGSSEVFALAATWPADEPAPACWAGGGRVVHPGIAVRVADPDTGAVLERGREGELQFRGPNVVDAYLGAEVPDAFTADGWFRSGDLGALVDDGAFVYTCRRGDALRLRGFLVDPAEIERRLAAHPDVGTAKVVGVPDSDGATRAVGFVVGAAGRAPVGEELVAWCREALAGFKVPAAVHVVDAMPTTAGTNGTKIKAAELRQWAQWAQWAQQAQEKG
ncbi:AMP-binding protein [Actinomycetospora cinnamomea]|uniref:Long-chain-fatty-acid--CoA ligase n=1 Tax=Actinomycetospora cinnamomea TaxID=663609 RepID=A0A2U1FLP2_9PSEU|nr:AMP-binding protein [Actinomycetospora cinnamomea]PVZ13087.1 fatty-acyl-CoA synthase [Actinomycetospora cinnamomea]